MALYATAKFSLTSLFKAPVSVILRGLSVTASASQQFQQDSAEPLPPSAMNESIENLFSDSSEPKRLENMFSDSSEPKRLENQFSESSEPKRQRFNKGINRVELLGGVGAQPLIKQTAQGSAIASFNLYTNVERRLSNGTSAVTTEVHNVIAFGGMARYVEKNVERGTRVYLTGRLHYTGGVQMVDGSRTPRICSVNLESIYPLSKSGAVVRLGAVVR